MYYSILWERLAGGIKLYVENYILSKEQSQQGGFNLKPSYVVDYEIQNLDNILFMQSLEDYYVHIIIGCRNINDLPLDLRNLAEQYLPRFFADYPEYKDEKCLQIDNSISEMEPALNDNVVIPEQIKSLSKEQKQAEIERLEQEAKKKKQEFVSRKNS